MRSEIDVEIERYVAPHAADDDNVYWLVLAGEPDREVQVDTAPKGQTPFTVEGDVGHRVDADDIEVAVRAIVEFLTAGQRRQ